MLSLLTCFYISAIEGGNPGTAQVLLSYGADPLLHDYSGNMPLDLATDRTMQLYFTNILADLHGKVPTRAKSESTFSTSVLTRWNVSHSPEFHLPPPHLTFMPLRFTLHTVHNYVQ